MHHLLFPAGEPSSPEPVEVQFSPEMHLLMTPTNGETLPQLDHNDYDMVRCYPSGSQTTVVERETNTLSRSEALKHEPTPVGLTRVKRAWLDDPSHPRACGCRRQQPVAHVQALLLRILWPTDEVRVEVSRGGFRLLENCERLS